MTERDSERAFNCDTLAVVLYSWAILLSEGETRNEVSKVVSYLSCFVLFPS